MNYRKLGNTDLKVSTICLGTMTWGEQNTQDEGFKQMDYALDQGVNFWDKPLPKALGLLLTTDKILCLDFSTVLSIGHAILELPIKIIFIRQL